MRHTFNLSPDQIRDVIGDEGYFVIAGPTASGKSALALALANAISGTIVNADSMQIYADLRVITARPSEADETTAPHSLYGVMDGAERASVARWLEMVATEAVAIRSAGRVPILTGGTGMYVNAAMHGIASIPDVPTDLHAKISARLKKIGGAAFRAELMALDPVTATRLFDGDSQRLVRAMGVVQATGRSISDWQQDPHQGMLTGTAVTIGVLPPREVLYERINARFDDMIAGGALDEVAALGARQLDPGLPVMKALGVRELLAYQAGTMSLDEAGTLAKRDSRHYAKRQMTWLRNNFNTRFVLNEKFSESFLKNIFSNLLKTN